MVFLKKTLYCSEKSLDRPKNNSI